MTYTLVHKIQVTHDIQQIVNYYKEISPKLATDFLYRLREANKHIILNPLGFQLKYKNVRTLMLKQFPYQIHYLIDDTLKQIIILAIIHAYKNPSDYTIRI